MKHYKHLPSPYYTRHRAKYGAMTSILEEPRHMRRTPEFARMSKAEHLALAEELTRQAIYEHKLHGRYLRLAERKYGKEGAILSGGHRDFWPMPAMQTSRNLSKERSEKVDAAYAHYKAAGKRRPYGQFYHEVEGRYRKTAHSRTK